MFRPDGVGDQNGNRQMPEMKSRILVVDDEKIFIDMLVDLLKDDYRVVVAKSGAEALERARAARRVGR